MTGSAAGVYSRVNVSHDEHGHGDHDELTGEQDEVHDSTIRTAGPKQIKH